MILFPLSLVVLTSSRVNDFLGSISSSTGLYIGSLDLVTQMVDETRRACLGKRLIQGH